MNPDRFCLFSLHSRHHLRLPRLLLSSYLGEHRGVTEGKGLYLSSLCKVGEGQAWQETAGHQAEARLVKCRKGRKQSTCKAIFPKCLMFVDTLLNSLPEPQRLTDTKNSWTSGVRCPREYTDSRERRTQEPTDPKSTGTQEHTVSALSCCFAGS